MKKTHLGSIYSKSAPIFEHPTASDSESDLSNYYLNEFLPLPWHDREDLSMQLVDEPSVVDTSKWTKITLLKTCKCSRL